MYSKPILFHIHTNYKSFCFIISSSAMDDSSSSEIAFEVPFMFRIFKDGHLEKLTDTEDLSPSLDPKTNVQSKDVSFSIDELNISARIFIPNSPKTLKLPLLIYFHGGAFIIGSASSPTYHTYLNSLVSEANVIAVSVNYRLAPENPLPAAYEDSWAAIKWISSHVNGNGPDDWLNRFADFKKVFLAGDSAGANISHHMCMRFGREKQEGVHIEGIVLVHPYFWGKDAINDGENAMWGMIDGLWRFVCPNTIGADDPLINFVHGPSLVGLGCSRVLICVAEKDVLKHRGWFYYEELKKSGWNGVVEIVEDEGENHVFHLFNPDSEKAGGMLKRIGDFLK